MCTIHLYTIHLCTIQDPQCVQGSLARALGGTETWVKPLADGSFAVVLLNKNDLPANTTVYMDDGGQVWGSGADFFPAAFTSKVAVRDLHARKDLGTFTSSFTAKVPAHDALILGFRAAPADPE
jgi:alpha-galactosidase